MNASGTPLPHPAAGGGSPAPTRRRIESHLQAVFPGLTTSAANRVAKAALERRRVQPELDVLAFAVADIRRRERVAGVPLLMRGFDPTPTNALRRLGVS